MVVNKIDLLEFIPKQTSFGYNVLYELFNKDNEQWIKIWYDQKKAKTRPIEVKRFVDQKILGSLLGQYQAEGTKYNNTKRKLAVEFSNSIIKEHKEFVNSLQELGIPRSMFKFELRNTVNKGSKTLNKLAFDFKNELGVYPKIYQHYSERGGYGFRTVVRSTILTHFVLSLMHNLRKIITKNKSLEDFSNAFFSKLLTGDGSISISKKKILGNVRIRISDENKEYLEDYKKIMENLDFNYLRDDKKHKAVEANCTLDNLLYLYKVRAFKNTNNWNKLLVIIGFYLHGKRVRVRLRLLDLFNKTFTHKDITKKYSLHPNDRKWLGNMIRKEYFSRVNSKPPYKYKLTTKANEFLSTIETWRIDLNKLMISKDTQDLIQLWQKLKRTH
jgi:hypothetical protein